MRRRSLEVKDLRANIWSIEVRERRVKSTEVKGEMGGFSADDLNAAVVGVIRNVEEARVLEVELSGGVYRDTPGVEGAWKARVGVDTKVACAGGVSSTRGGVTARHGFISWLTRRA